MESTPENQSTGNSDFIAFSGNNDQDFRSFRSYNRPRYGNPNFKPFYGGNRHDGQSQFSPPNFSSPISNNQQRSGGGYQGYHQRRNYFGNSNYYRNNNRNQPQNWRSGPNPNHQKADVPIQQYFHQSMLEDPWSECYRFNGMSEAEKVVEKEENIENAVNEEKNEESNSSDSDNKLDDATAVN